MEIFKSFKLFGLYFYISNVRMKRRRTIDEQMRNRRNALLRKKRFLYQLRGGCCELCGKHFALEALEIHHLVPVSQNPGLALQTKNLILLCHDCHVKVHQGKESAVKQKNRP
ncbi:HNH endonuclease [Pseudoprevotella muciniphila]|uniref:HNH endonuclease n=1 Tax=Pseudoprevotella muciniphila TaxID=2133944 RepID=A0A5P8E3J3_9BACT|nr:HNH endonuclease signature motif containing protein [Pseudoprevotella muciniphila]QFQ11559.1 HNH endonuclease [Pseudoprevotella muciniphila]